MVNTLVDKKIEEISKRLEDISHLAIAKKICDEHKIIFCQEFYEYEDGCYHPVAEERIHSWIKAVVGDKFKIRFAEEVIFALQTDTYLETDKLNNTPFLNLKNGLLDLTALELLPHSPDIYSTIRLDVSYDPDARCPKWDKTVSEIFEGDAEKIEATQEFFGLCLTRETKFEKALLLLGEGANGKSTLLHLLQMILGAGNFVAIPLEKFNNHFYVASLFGKLTNISIETNAKSEVYDANFKGIVSGDSLTADHKYKKVFTFRPFCKLIFAVNALPRVDDKTDSFFRRLLIIRFNKTFAEEEQNKNLKAELAVELDGIFLWCLEGLKRLRGRGYFRIGEGIQQEIKEYRKENNNVLLFVEEDCVIREDLSISKQGLYSSYSEWCRTSGYRPVSKRKLGAELLRHFRNISEDRVGAGRTRTWVGIGFESCLSLKSGQERT
ncbi:MAG: phage/plasmid primase, P4 family [Candidatus Omnitrophota bacterium]|nr:phage/plasmid primase, P4 family [Candidatus Omnitrophota bacterium]